MITDERKSLLLSRLARDGRIIAKALAEELATSEDTIRRDLRELASEGRLRRVHGGALPLEPALPDYAARTGIATDEKSRLGRKAARLIGRGETVFLDGGTTHLALIAALPRDLEATIVTHAPTIASAFERFPHVTLDLIGGRIYRHSMVATGASALSQILARRFDRAFLGVTGAHAIHGLTTGDAEEAAIKRAFTSQAAETIVLLTATKIGVASPVTIRPLDGVRILVDDGVSQAELVALIDAGALLGTG